MSRDGGIEPPTLCRSGSSLRGAFSVFQSGRDHQLGVSPESLGDVLPAVVNDAQRGLDVIQNGAAHPVNLATNQAKGFGLTTQRRAAPVEPDASRGARPVRRRLVRVTPQVKGLRINPHVLSDANARSIGSGATRTCLCHREW